MCAIPALAVVEQSDSFFVADYANVLKPSTENMIVNSNNDAENGLSALCDGAEVVVVTVKYLDGMYSDEYAAQLFNDWQVGDARQNNGMLLLLATEEKKGWLEVGSGIRSYWTSNRINALLDTYFWDDVDAGRYDEAVNATLEQIFTWFADEYGLFQEVPQDNSGPYTEYNNDYNMGSTYQPAPAPRINGFWVFVAVVILIAVISNIGRDRRRYRSYYTHVGTPMPRYHFWYGLGFGGRRPYRTWYRQQPRYRAPPPPPRYTSNTTRYNPNTTRGNGTNTRSGGGFGGFGGSSGGSSRGSGYGGFGGSSGRSSGGGSRSSGGGGRSSGGGRSGGGGGRR